LVKISKPVLSLHMTAKRWDIGWLREIFVIYLEKSKSIFAFRAVTEFKPYKSKRRRNIGLPRKRWRDQLHLEDQGTGNTPKPS